MNLQKQTHLIEEIQGIFQFDRSAKAFVPRRTAKKWEYLSEPTEADNLTSQNKPTLISKNCRNKPTMRTGSKLRNPLKRLKFGVSPDRWVRAKPQLLLGTSDRTTGTG
jgi:hypothetical protein